MTAVNNFNQAAQSTVLLVGRQSAEITSFADQASKFGWRTIFCTDLVEANTALDSSPDQISAVILDEDANPGRICEAVADLKHRDRRLAVIAIASSASSRWLLEALSAGAGDCISKPIVPEQLLQVLRRATSRAGRIREREPCADQFECRIGFDSMIEADPSFRAAWAEVVTSAQGQGHVLIEGEPGTGKGLLARAIHAASPRARMPLNVADFSRTSAAEIAPLLFGYERGAFVGAFESRQGLLERCHGATLLLNDVDGLPAPIQEELGEALSRRYAQRLGGANLYHFDVRIIALSNSRLVELVASKAFSAKLHQNFDSARIHLPALRDRPADIALIAREFVNSFRDPRDLRTLRIDEDSLTLLCGFGWPGNSRQLLAFLLRAIAGAKDPVLTPEDFTNWLGFGSLRDIATPANVGKSVQPEMSICTEDGHLRSLDEIEADVIRFAIGRYGGCMTEVARRLRIGRSTLYRRLGDLGIDGFPR